MATRQRRQPPSLLLGVFFTDNGERFPPAFTRKANGAMYRYYMPIRKARMTQIIQTGDATIQRREPKLTTVIPVRIKRHGGRMVVIPAPESPEAEAPEHHEPILTALSRAFHWQRLLDEGQMTSRVEIARQEGLRQIQPPGCVRRDQCPPRPRFRINRTLAFAFDKVKRQMGR